MESRKKPTTYSEGQKLLEEAKKAGIHPDYIKGLKRGLSSLSKDGEPSPKEELIKYAEKTKDPEYIKHVKEMNNPKNINARLNWHRQNEDGGPGSGIKGHTTESSEESFWENKLREVAKQKGISESDIESLISQVKKGGAKAIMSSKDGTKDSDPKVAEAESIINLCGGVK